MTRRIYLFRALGLLFGIAAVGAILGAISNVTHLHGSGVYAVARAVFGLLLLRASQLLLPKQGLLGMQTQITTVRTEQWDETVALSQVYTELVAFQTGQRGVASAEQPIVIGARRTTPRHAVVGKRLVDSFDVSLVSHGAAL